MGRIEELKIKREVKRRVELNLKDVIDLINPYQEKGYILYFYDKDHDEVCIADSCSSFLIPLYEKKVETIRARDRNKYNIFLEGEI